MSSKQKTSMSRSDAGKLGYIKSKTKIRQYYEKIKQEYYNSPKCCKSCGSQIPYEKRRNKFCSHSCAAKTTNIGVTRNGNKRQEHKCKFCNNLTKNPVFCSKECYGKFYHKKSLDNILECGSISGVSTNVARKALRHIRGEKCEICGITEWNGKIVPLVMDHIDGNSDNNNLENLRLVCGNCDMQLPKYKSNNKGNGRAYRRKRYKEGKSY